VIPGSIVGALAVAAPQPAAARTRSDSLLLEQMVRTRNENWNQKQRLIHWWRQPPTQVTRRTIQVENERELAAVEQALAMIRKST